ncbi:MAG: YodL domain-containing protein [Blautia caecimuris]
MNNNKVTCTIYQTETAPYLFREWEEAKEKLSIKDYDNKYEIELDDELDVIILEKLFELFNINHPKDYQCRSMSVSNIVRIERNGNFIWYYCDRIGWKDISHRINS